MSYGDAAGFRLCRPPRGKLASSVPGPTRSTGFENVTGSGLGDQLIGDAAGNEIDGLGGDDTIVGQGGADVLTGGAGADIFMYNATGDADDDFAVLEEIEDFVSGSGDVIHLAHIDTDAGAAGDQGFTFIGTAAFSATARGRGPLQRRRGLRRHNGNDVGAEMAIALSGVTSVTAADFVL